MAPASTETVRELPELWGELELETRLVSTSDGARAIELTPRVDLQRPDTLLYWQPAGATELSDGSLLLGSVAGTQRRRFALPARAGDEPGTLVLYSLGHSEVVATAELAAFGTDTESGS